MKIAERVENCYRLFGVSGVLLTVAHRAIRRPRHICVPCYGKDVYLRLDTSDQCVYKEVVLDKDYEFDLDFTPKVIIDAGANIGLSSIYYANRYPSSQIIAIEPEISNFAMLQRNARPYKQVTPVHAALWNYEGWIHMSNPLGQVGGWNKWGITTSEQGKGEPVRSVSIRSLMDEFKLSRIDLLKVDIEGSEVEVFSNCDWLPSVNALVVETHDRFRLGCSTAVDAAASDFRKTCGGSTGNLALYTRHGSTYADKNSCG